MVRVSSSEAREDLSALLNRVAFGKERVILTRRGKALVAVIPVEDFALLEQLEDLVDLEEARKALADPANQERISWDKVKVDLGL
ncbi:MAG: type II toxin-antitoxin system Phd/YefM family antitoxin [Chloroflexi bacterium]|nr:type II toxin-antitoxin system Phd/YefM family antitoxin [Chloroflexota bacterium]